MYDIIRRWIMRQSWMAPLLRWCPRHDAYHLGPAGHLGRLWHD